MKTLALVMIVKNEENNLKRCIDSVKDIVNEIIIVDTGSTDFTKSIAVEKGAKLFEYKWKKDFSDARNFSIKQSTSDWNLVLDADEYILSNAESLKYFIENNDNRIGRINILSKYFDNGQEMVESTYVTRLFPNKAIFFKGKVHEQLDTNLPRVNIPVSVAHDGYYLTDKTDRNLPLLLEELNETPSDAYILYQIGKQYYLKKEYTKANNYFSSSYKNIKNNVNYKPKMVIDYMYSLIKSGNLEFGLRIIEKEKNNLTMYTDFHFVCGVFFMELVFSNVNKFINYLPFIEHQYLRCLEIGEDEKQEIVKGTGSFLALYNLGTVYEAMGNIDKAVEYYKKSSEYKYKPATKRLEALRN
ncbi:glycosyltransferase [Fictibacillus phosphorivorans]|uniref:glycosyltransferase n=1 Tax=Fictibacillus phosphorivorans TaxID=1221500 RepID=UPI0011A27CF9|nr:glycosyltransferase [Fictibacillus phosphorivorans]